MHDISSPARRLALEGAPRFVEAVRSVQRKNRLSKRRHALLLTLDAFYDDPMLLYACLWFAYSRGVEVRFFPKTYQAETNVRLEAAKSQK